MSGHPRDDARLKDIRFRRSGGLRVSPEDVDFLLAHEEAERERAERLRDVVDAAEILVVMIEEPAARGLMGEDWPAYYHGASLAVREKLDALAALSAREHGKEQS